MTETEDKNYIWRNFKPKRRAAKQHAFYAGAEGTTEQPVCKARLTYLDTTDPSEKPFGLCPKCLIKVRYQTRLREEAAFIAERDARQAAVMQLPSPEEGAAIVREVRENCGDLPGVKL